MPTLYSGASIVAALATFGFLPVSQKGSHRKLRDGNGQTAIVPMHKQVAPGTFRSIAKQAGLDADMLRNACR
jgi:predicted RNA binding protein YcfA (HicA-like mRNA interferase family)